MNKRLLLLFLLCVTATVSLLAQAPQAVDLGLSVKWASCNLGATSPEQCGGYYAWGELEEKKKYDIWSDVKYRLMEKVTMKYDGRSHGTKPLKNHLNDDDDIVHFMFGGKWRMPTKAECEELVNKCVKEKCTMNKVLGFKFTGPNGNSIFLPLTGYKSGKKVAFDYNSGQYISRDLYYDGDYLAHTIFYGIEFYLEKVRDSFSLRADLGFSIRPVADSGNENNGIAPTLTWLSTPATTSQRQVTVKVGVKSSSQITQTAVYVNGQQSRGAVVVKNDGYDMTISHTVTLTQGQNVIKVTAANASGTASGERTITYNDNSISKPTLTWILAPANTTQKQQTIKVGVKSKSPITQTAVYVNGQQSRGAVVVKNDGYDMTISHTVTLLQGQNIIKVTVANASGMASVEHTVAYAQSNVPQPAPQPIAPVQREKRLALVIGNANYAGQALANPVNDATDMASKLRTLGFDVIFLTDGTKRNIEDKINEFGEKASHYDVAMFYYAGHGIQYNGSNYLIPIGANMKSKGDIEYECTDMGRVLTKMEESGCKMKIVALDACRNNPFERSWYRGAGQSGLSAVNAPVGTFISYATSPGSTAADGQDRNSPYTKALLQTLATPGLTIERVFKDVALKVFNSTNRQQTPWYSSSLFQGDFIFNNGKQ